MNLRILAATALLAAVALSGCSGDDEPLKEEDTPVQISRTDVERLERLVSEENPRAFAFPGQQALEPVFRVINGTLGPATGMGAEPIDDEGPADVGGDIVAHDISEMVAPGQPVELRVKLVWWGDPGASADMDIYINVPGTYTTYSPGFSDESWNWNIVTKQAVVNTVAIEGEPFEIGAQVQTGKIVHPEGMRYSLEVQAHFPQDVLPPLVPHALTLPSGATGFIIESEPVTGDEHIETEMTIIGPDDQLHRAVIHNDIGTETLFIPATRPGEYVFYIAEQHGGFVRVETDVENPGFEARLLEKTVTPTSIMSGAIVAPAVPDEGSYGAEGEIPIEGGHPLDVYGYLTAPAGQSLIGELQLDILSDGGIVHTVWVEAPASYGEAGRIGDSPSEDFFRENLANGLYTYGLRGNLGMNADAGYVIVSYTR